MSRTAALAALGPALLGLAGCFDVHMVGAGTLVIDDFDDGDFLPTDPTLNQWICFTFNPQRATGYRCDHGAGFASPYSLFLQDTVDDPPDGLEQNGGSGLGAFGNTPQDLSHFRELVFSAELESGFPALPSNAELHVELGCSTARADDGTVHNDLAVIQIIQKMDYASSWQTKTLAMANFTPPFYLPTHIAGGPTACLQRVDSIQFIVQPMLADGQSTSFTLHVDDVFLR